MKIFRTLLSWSLSVAMLLSLTACGTTNMETSSGQEETKTTVPEDNENLQVLWKEDYQIADDGTTDNPSYYVNEYILLSDEAPITFDNLKSSLNTLMEKQQQDMESGREEISKKSAEERDSYGVCFVRHEAYVRRADYRVLSILYVTRTHPGDGYADDTSFEGVTFDSVTGKQLSLTDVVTDQSSMLEAAEEQLDLYYPDRADQNKVKKATKLTEEEIGKIAWTIDNIGLTLILTPGLIANEAAGTFTVTLPFAQYPDLFKEGYGNGTNNYFVMLSDEIPYYCDLDQDGTPEQISYGTDEKDQTFVSHRIDIGYAADTDTKEHSVASYEEDISCVQDIPLLVNNWDGGYGIFDEMTHDTDSYETEIFDLTGDSPTVLDSVDAGFYHLGKDDFDNNYKDAMVIPVDTTQIQMQKETSVLSVAPAVFLYGMESELLPACQSDLGQIRDNVTFTTLQPIKATEIDMTTMEEFGEATIPANIKLTYIFTDNQLCGYVHGDNKKDYKITLDDETYPHKVDGTNLEDLLDGILFY